MESSSGEEVHATESVDGSSCQNQNDTKDVAVVASDADNAPIDAIPTDDADQGPSNVSANNSAPADHDHKPTADNEDNEACPIDVDIKADHEPDDTMNTRDSFDVNSNASKDADDKEANSKKGLDCEKTKSHNKSSNATSKESGADGENAVDNAEANGEESGEEVKFKRLKLSHTSVRHRRPYRDRNSTVEDDDEDVEAGESSSKQEEPPDGEGSLDNNCRKKGKSRRANKESDEGLSDSSSSTSGSSDNGGGEGTSKKRSRLTAADLEELSRSSSSSSSATEEDNAGPADEDNDNRPRMRARARRIVRNEEQGTSSDSDNRLSQNPEPLESSDTEDEVPESNDKISEQAQKIMDKRPPPPSYNLLKDIYSMRRGNRLAPSFGHRFCASQEVVKRFELHTKLVGHDGCVNALNFNQTGSKIASGSDDMKVILWDWERNSKLLEYDTEHKANVFQSKFLPGDLLVTSCSRDGQVRLAELCVTGTLRSTKKLAEHRGPVHKMSLLQDSQYVVLSGGEDGQVISIDIREQKPDKILLQKNDRGKMVPIYSVHCNPGKPHLFCTAGRDQFIRIYDRRYLSSESKGIVTKFCPSKLRSSDTFKAYLTAAVFSHDGNQLIGSYNDDDIYLFQTNDPETAEPVKQYCGHRNNATVKGVNFYGPKSEYVISGSDCGNIFFWSKETEAIINVIHGDDNGVVNVLEPHPTLPVLATSGLDEEVKVWMPTLATHAPHNASSLANKNNFIKTTIERNLQDREEQRSIESDPMDGQMLWELWRHIRRVDRRRRTVRNAAGGREDELSDDSEADEDPEEQDSDEERGPRRIDCTQS